MGGHVQRHLRSAHELLGGDHAVERTFQFATAAGDAGGDEFQHIIANGKRGILLPGEIQLAAQDSKPQGMIRLVDVHHQAAIEPRAHALIQPVELAGRHVCGNDHLPARIHQRGEGVAELLLHGAPLQELEIVDQQDVHGLEGILERQHIAVFQRGQEAIHEALRGDVENAAPRCVAQDVPGNGVEQVRLAQAGRRMNVQGIDAQGHAMRLFRHPARGGKRQGVGFAGDEGVEGQGRIKRRAVFIMHTETAGGRRKRCSRPAILHGSRRGRRLGPRAGNIAHKHADVLHLLEFLKAQPAEDIEIMGLDPVLEKACGYGNLENAVRNGLQRHAPEPAGIEITPQLRLQTFLHPLPGLFAVLPHRLAAPHRLAHFLHRRELPRYQPCHGAKTSPPGKMPFRCAVQIDTVLRE